MAEDRSATIRLISERHGSPDIEDRTTVTDNSTMAAGQGAGML